MMERYNKSPSEILKIEDDYMAYMLDEAILLIERKVGYDKKGRFDYSKFLTEINPNQGMMEHIKSMQR